MAEERKCVISPWFFSDFHCYDEEVDRQSCAVGFPHASFAVARGCKFSRHATTRLHGMVQSTERRLQEMYSRLHAQCFPFKCLLPLSMRL
jgi:hypothetical protein